MVEGTAQSGWPSCVPHFFSSLEPSLPNIWSTHLVRTSAYWGHPISNQLPPPQRAFLSGEAGPAPPAHVTGPDSRASPVGLLQPLGDRLTFVGVGEPDLRGGRVGSSVGRLRGRGCGATGVCRWC